jgi:hypothetical protein
MTLVTSDGQKVSTSSAALRHAGSGWDLGPDDDDPELAGGELISRQVTELSWKDAWRHELRGPHGEWIRSGEALTSDFLGNVKARLGQVRQDKTIPPDLRDSIRDAQASLTKGDLAGAVNHLVDTVNDPRLSDSARTELRTAMQDIAGQADAERSHQLTPEARVTRDLIAATAVKVAAMLGPHETLALDYKAPTVFPDASDPTIDAEIDWDGHIRINQTTATGIADALSGTGPVANPDAPTVLLHEMVHAALPDEDSDRQANGDKLAYQTAAGQSIEEGFTQLATTNHAAEFFNAAGIGDRETPYLAVGADGSPVTNPGFSRAVGSFADDLFQGVAKIPASEHGASYAQAASDLGREAENLKNNPEDILDSTFNDSYSGALSEVQHLGDHDLADWAMTMKDRGRAIQGMPLDKHATMAEYAKTLADPERIKNGTSWGHYNEWTADAYNWSAEISKRIDGKTDQATVQKLTDQVSSVGTAAKTRVMAEQLLAASHLMEDRTLTRAETGQALRSAQEQIMTSWGKVAAETIAASAAAKMRGTVAAMRGEAAA